MTTSENPKQEEMLPVDPATKAVSNPATQTLFRFVSMRNPQLAKKEGNLKFIFRPNTAVDTFDNLAIQWNDDSNLAPTKIDYYIKKIISNPEWFHNRIRSEEHFESLYPDLYSVVKKFTIDGVESLLGADLNKVMQAQANMQFIWTAIIYQIVLQEDFYLKEFITHVLQVIHYAENNDYFSKETNAKRKKEKQIELATAKVVIPDYLFIDSTSLQLPVTQQDQILFPSPEAASAPTPATPENEIVKESNLLESQQYFPTESDLKRQNVALATYKKQQLESLKKELLKTQTLYNKQYTNAYDLAAKDYQNLIKPIYDAYEHQLLQVEATFTEEMTEASKKLALSQVAKPALPDFEFEFRAERDVVFLQNKLSKTSLESFVSLIGEYASPDTVAGKLNNDVLQENIVEIGKDHYILPAEENLNFEEMLETINSRLSELNDEIYQNTEVEKQEYVSVGGVLILVDNNLTTSKTESKSFSVATIFNANTWSVLLTFKDLSISIINASYSAKTSNVTIDDGSFVQSGSGVYKLFNGTQVLPINNFKNGFLLDVEFTLSDGKKYTAVCSLTHTSPGNDTSISGYLTGGTDLNIKDTSTGEDTGGNPDTGGENPETPSTTVSTTNSFIPKGFGIKRLGIADYLKVEQSTHAYVEGEVAAIENIMAREYREKSTRRLRRSEVTETTSSDTEREQLTDTTTASRFEMQSEIAKMQQEATDVGVNASAGYSGGGFNINVAASYANHRSKEESMRQAVSQAQDITARALDRVVTKVHKERIEKIIEEFEENNSHGFDNRKGDKHVVGVYRWVDKLMKNQVWDYGKRLMFEFAIPQPAKIHTLAMASLKNGKVIEKPVDPRRADKFTMKDYTALTEENVFKYWLSEYNVETESIPASTVKITKAFAYGKDKVANISTSDTSAIGIQDTIKIPEGYVSTSYSISGGGKQYTKDGPSLLNINVGDQQVVTNNTSAVISSSNFFSGYTDEVAVGISTDRFYSFETVVAIICQLSDDAKKKWQQKTFTAIIEAYETALKLYNQEVAEEETKAGNIKETNANFYRQIEQDVLKHNCIAYMVDPKVLGTKLYDKENIENFEVIKDKNLDEYASLSKFMEQAFEWNIMSYDFYPYYWGAKKDWQALYQSESMDPLFRSFLQSGMARVIATVRPGFEDAIQFYMATGRLWNGGEVPVIGDPMYLSIVDELKDIKGKAQGKSWITRIPTSLTILQAQNIGLEVAQALPFTTEDPLDFENPEQVITVSNFKKSDAQMEAEKSKLVENIEINNDYLQLTNNDNPHQVIAQLSLEDLKEALE